MTFPARYQLPQFEPYTKSPGSPDLDTTASTSDFRAIASAFHAEFFSEHPDTETFIHIVKLLLAKILDERSRRPSEPYAFQVLQVNGREEAAKELFVRVRPLYESAYKSYIDPQGQDTLDHKVFPPERVKSVVKGLQGVSITRGAAIQGDVIGAFFEEILRTGFKQDKGMYFTHANLVWFMLETIDLSQLTKDIWRAATHPDYRMPYVIDPSCGSGTFLLRAMQMMSAAIRNDRAALVVTADDERYFRSHLSDDNPNEWAQDFLYGLDPKFVMAITAKVNMVLHGDGSAHIFKWDGLKRLADAPDAHVRPQAQSQRSLTRAAYPPDLCEQFDAVVSNPPFGITLAPETERDIQSNFSLPDRSSSEALFLERYAQLLKPGGRLGVVIPESLMNTTEHREVRLFLYRMFWIRAIVSLPRNLFVETPTLTSLLFAQKKRSGEVKQWDAEWEAATARLDAAVASARAESRLAARRPGASPRDVETALLNDISPYISSDSFVLSRGRPKGGVPPAVMPLRLPTWVNSAQEALDYYEKVIRSSTFKKTLSVNAIFRQVANAFPHKWGAYAVTEVGYKLSKRGERARQNQLVKFVNSAGIEHPNVHTSDDPLDILVDTSSPERILDYVRRDVEWA